MSAKQWIAPPPLATDTPVVNGTDDKSTQADAPRKPLSDYAVDHKSTVPMTWEEIDALRPPFVIDGFVRRGELLLLGAESKSRKSWLAQDAALCVAGGFPWLADEDGQNGYETAQSRVHVMDLELAESECRYRFAKARNHRIGCHLEREAITARVASYSLDGVDSLKLQDLIENDLKATVKPGDLAIIDCFYRLQADGNETEIVAKIIEMLKRFASETQAALIVVDHFRKAGAEKARDRFAGSFVKSASPSTLVAIETQSGDILKMSVDARTFYGVPTVHCRFNSATYAFEGVSDEELAALKEGVMIEKSSERLRALFKSRHLGDIVDTKDAAEAWEVTRQAVAPHMAAMTQSGLLEKSTGPKNANQWKLTEKGREIVVKSENYHPSVT